MSRFRLLVGTVLVLIVVAALPLRPSIASSAPLRSGQGIILPPVFPAESTLGQMFPTAATVTLLSPQDLPGPIKPLGRIEFDFAPFTTRISIFQSLDDATVSFNWAMNHLKPSDQLLASSPADGPGLRRYTMPGFTVAAILYRNIEIVTSALESGATSDQVAGSAGQAYGSLDNLYQSDWSYSI